MHMKHSDHHHVYRYFYICNITSSDSVHCTLRDRERYIEESLIKQKSMYPKNHPHVGIFYWPNHGFQGD